MGNDQAEPHAEPPHDLFEGKTLPVEPPAADDPPLATGSAVESRGRRAPGRGEDLAELATIDPTRYLLGREIARGGMGRIVSARDRRLGRTVAIKELLAGTAAGEFRSRFEREARITAKLQHPAIVNLLEAGAWPSGEPFYVMKLVAGESLDQVIAKRKTLEARLGLLPHIIAAVDALAYAHSLRIIHRDLKPANVLVGDFGETVVIDWGLAKDLADPGASDVSIAPHRKSSPPPASQPGKSDVTETLAGSVIGTPAYMPSEQALGDPVDERADVYALGAMLYHVLAGVAPYVGKTAAEILYLVANEPPPPLASRTPGIPPDLVTIVHKAMAHDAADRYPTARELSDDLKKFQTGHLVSAHDYTAWQLVRRWVRRHRTPVAVASVAIALLVGLGVVSVRRIVGEQARTDAQREVAERNRGAAEDLTSYMLGELRDKLQPLGKLDLLDNVAKKAVDYYDMRGNDLSDLELGKRARARRNLGDVLRQQRDGDLPGALRQYQASLAITKTLAAHDPTDAQRQRDLADSHEKVGDVTFAQGDAAGALAAYREARAIRVALTAKDPTKPDWQLDLAGSHDKVGTVIFAQGDAPGALAEYRASLEISKALAARDPGNLDWQSELAIAHTAVGNVLFKQRDLPGALAEYRAALAISEALAPRDPANVTRQRALSVGHNKIGNVLHAQGDAAGALREYRADLAISEALAASDPTNAERQADVTVTHNKIGNALLAQNDAAGALAEYRASVAINEALVAKDPTNADRQRALSVGHNKAGDARATAGDRLGALEDYQQARTIIEVLAAKDPTNAELQVDLAVSHQRIGDVVLAQGDKPGARAEYEAGLAIAQALLVKQPTNADAKEVVDALTAAIAPLH